MVMIDKGRFRHYNNPGAMLYIPNRLFNDPKWPFEDGELVKIIIDVENHRVIETRARWYEMLDWRGSPDMYATLKPEIKEQIQQSGILLI